MSLDNTNNVLAILKIADSQFDITPVKQTNTLTNNHSKRKKIVDKDNSYV